MNPSLLAALGALLMVLLVWRGRGRPPIPLVRNGDTSAVAALNRAQIALTQASGHRTPSSTTAPDTPAPALGLVGWVDPPMGHNSHAQRLYRARLEAAFRAGGGDRLEAVRQARRWGHRSTLPLLRQALRATDLAVVREAAIALERFRGRSASGESVLLGPPLGRPLQLAGAVPRKVLRTR